MKLRVSNIKKQWKFCWEKDNHDGDMDLAPIYFSSTTKTEINFKYDFDKSFKEVLYRIHNWINEGSGWITESIDAEYVKIFCL